MDHWPYKSQFVHNTLASHRSNLNQARKVIARQKKYFYPLSIFSSFVNKGQSLYYSKESCVLFISYYDSFAYTEQFISFVGVMDRNFVYMLCYLHRCCHLLDANAIWILVKSQRSQEKGEPEGKFCKVSNLIFSAS